MFKKRSLQNDKVVVSLIGFVSEQRKKELK